MKGVISILWILKIERTSKADFLYYVTMEHKVKSGCFCKGLIANFRYFIQIITVTTSSTGYAILGFILKRLRSVWFYTSINFLAPKFYI
jgi:hypothetical protein